MSDPRAARPGRPRSVALDEAIVAATLDLLAERGYAAMSLAAVAERAGTTTAALYRRFATKVALVVAVVFRTDGDDVVADTGDFDADVATMIRWSLAKYASPHGRAALSGLLSEPSGSDRLVALVDVWRRIGERLERAQARGEARADIDVSSIIVAIVGPAMAAAAVHGEAAMTDEWVDRIATVALDGMRPLRRPDLPRSATPRATVSR